MAEVRFHAIQSEQLRELMQTAIVSNNPECKALVQAALDFHEEDNFKKPLVETVTGARGKEGFVIQKQSQSNHLGRHQFKFMSLVTGRRWNSILPIQLVGDITTVRVNTFLFLFAAQVKSEGPVNGSRKPVALRYDANFDTWMELEPVPQAITSGPAVALFGNKIFFIGGSLAESYRYDNIGSYCGRSQDDYGQSTNKVWTYHIGTDEWSEAKSLPAILCNAAATGCSTDNRVYLTGGQRQNAGDKKALADVYAYHVDGGVWVARPPMNIARHNHFMESTNNKLFAIGGLAGSQYDRYGYSDLSSRYIEHVEQYDTFTEQWSIVLMCQDVKFSVQMGYVSHNGLYILTGGREEPLRYTQPQGGASQRKVRPKQKVRVLMLDTSSLRPLTLSEVYASETVIDETRQTTEQGSDRTGPEHLPTNAYYISSESDDDSDTM